jgi:TolB-like protein/class 3 adenylate cyclase/thioredoxin-like negative regulator of GroEL
LAAILAADVVGYSALIRADEEGARKAVRHHIAETVEPQVSSHRGRVFKTTGDGLLAEFGSVVDAVRCAVDIQNAISDANAAIAADRRIAFRIGVNLGDVMAEGDDLHGDGVNVAARLEGLADPNGVCISGSAFEQVRDKLELGFEDLGDQQVKNIDRPVRAYRVLTDPAAAGTFVAAPTRRTTSWMLPAIAAAVVLIIAAVWLAWWQPWAPDVDPASLERMAFPLPEKPSIAVLPFANMSDDPSQDYFADGITEDLITDLSRISGLFVIARNSSFSYKGERANVRRVAEDLGVRYVLGGSVRRAADQVRINAQLIDATTGNHLWAERYDGTLADVFALQDQVTERIVAQLAVRLTAVEAAQAAARETENPAAFDAFLQGWEYFRRTSPDDYAEAIPYLEKAVQLDPEYSRAHAALAEIYRNSAYLGWFIGDVSPSEAAERAIAYLREATKNPTPLAHQVSARVLLRQGRQDEALAQAESAVALNPNDPSGQIATAEVLISSGRWGEALASIDKAIRLNPHYPAEYLFWQGLAQFSAAQYEEAAATMERATQRNPDRYSYFTLLAASFGHLGRKEQAASAVARANEERSKVKRPDLSVGVAAYWPVPVQESLAQGLRVAGVPELPLGYAGRAENKLTGSEIRALLFGKTYHGFDPFSGGEWITSIDEDGKTVTKSPWYSGRQTRWVEDDLLCFRNQGSAESAKVCALIFRNPGGTAEKRDEFHWVGGPGIYPFAVCDCPRITQ